jgi:hypothetical protein
MAAEIFLPGCVLLTKLGFKIFVDQRPAWVDAFRAILMFPADMTFLCFSYGAAALTFHEIQAGVNTKASTTIGIALVGVLFAFLTNRISRAIEAYFDEDKYFLASFLALIGYGISSFVLYAALNVGDFV